MMCAAKGGGCCDRAWCSLVHYHVLLWLIFVVYPPAALKGRMMGAECGVIAGRGSDKRRGETRCDHMYTRPVPRDFLFLFLSIFLSVCSSPQDYFFLFSLSSFFLFFSSFIFGNLLRLPSLNYFFRSFTCLLRVYSRNTKSSVDGSVSVT